MHGHAQHLAVKKIREMHQSKSHQILNSLAYALGIIGPLMTVPQIYKVWIQRDVAGLSLLSWGAFAVLSIFWCYYAFVHKERPLIISQGLWALMNIFVVTGVLLYR